MKLAITEGNVYHSTFQFDFNNGIQYQGSFCGSVNTICVHAQTYLDPAEYEYHVDLKFDIDSALNEEGDEIQYITNKEIESLIEDEIREYMIENSSDYE